MLYRRHLDKKKRESAPKRSFAIPSKTMINIGWLFPTLLSTYGDRGNLLCLQKRLQWRNIACCVIPLDQTSSPQAWEKVDLLLGGGAQDKEQTLVMHHLSKGMAPFLIEKVRSKTPALFTCASFQLLGKYYTTSQGKIVEGIGLLDLITTHQGYRRCVGNAILKPTAKPLCDALQTRLGHVPYLIGFENHGGCTDLKGHTPLASVIQGFGNNRTQTVEGVFYENMIGTYLHGPILPKNPFLADWLIEKALEKKDPSLLPLTPLNDLHVHSARAHFLPFFS